MNKKIFRETSLKRVNSPEQLNDYIKVAKPSIWIMLGAIVCLLIGIVVWGVFGVIETKVDTGAVVSDGQTVCYVSTADASKIVKGMTVVVNNETGKVESVATAPTQIGKEFNSSLLYLVGLKTGDFCYAVKLNVSGLKDGTYKASITTERISPISFITN
jgi:hypothetical protein